MSGNDAALLRRALRPTATGEDHPALEALAAYAAGEMSTSDEERLQAHLVGCRTCAQQFLDLKRFRATSKATSRQGSEFETAAAWRTMRDQLPTTPTAPPAARRPVRGLYAVAATLLLATLGLLIWVLYLERNAATLRQQVAMLQAPRANVPILYLDAVTRSAPAEEQSLEVAAAAPFFLLILTPDTDQIYADYAVEIRDTDEGLAWQGDGLRLSEHGTLRLGLAREHLAAGRYRVVLHGLDGTRRDALGTYVIEILG